MQYFGGKSRIGKQIAQYIQIHRKYDTYFEPFVGGLNVLIHVPGKRIASDINPYIIETYKAIQGGWIPPDEISEEEYKRIKNNKDEDKPLTGFCGVAMSFSGIWFIGYARDNKKNRSYCRNGKNSILKKGRHITDVEFVSAEYNTFTPKNMVIYCDPPYFNTVQGYVSKRFDTELFWETMRLWSRSNQVFISEYKAPDDFKCVLEIHTKTEIRTSTGREPRIERLFSII